MTKRRSRASHLNSILFLTLGLLLLAGRVQAQNLGLEGETGGFITPFANTAPSPANGLGKPVVSYHFLNTGDVVGPFSWISVTEAPVWPGQFGYNRHPPSTAP